MDCPAASCIRYLGSLSHRCLCKFWRSPFALIGNRPVSALEALESGYLQPLLTSSDRLIALAPKSKGLEDSAGLTLGLCFLGQIGLRMGNPETRLGCTKLITLRIVEGAGQACASEGRSKYQQLKTLRELRGLRASLSSPGSCASHGGHGVHGAFDTFRACGSASFLSLVDHFFMIIDVGLVSAPEGNPLQ
jgi:hypothetical protein